ncbi:MAG: cyclic nucleotide-binding domain-containing protein [Chitinispirillaceae bacterium]|nr:cyclic nucleotide-binding domain-containing protein [Chitinispirillaceae bacterium]
MNIQASYALLEKILVLKKSTLFASVTTSELRAVAAVAEELHFRPGELIVKEKDIGDALYLIKSGSVTISKLVGGERSVDLARMEEGECFGEMAAIDEEVRSATVSALQECSVLRICKENLQDVLRENPQIGIEFLRIFVKRLRSANEKIEVLLSQSAVGVK